MKRSMYNPKTIRRAPASLAHPTGMSDDGRRGPSHAAPGLQNSMSRWPALLLLPGRAGVSYAGRWADLACLAFRDVWLLLLSAGVASAATYYVSPTGISEENSQAEIIPDKDATTYALTRLDQGTYYFAVTAVDTAGKEVFFQAR